MTPQQFEDTCFIFYKSGSHFQRKTVEDIHKYAYSSCYGIIVPLCICEIP